MKVLVLAPNLANLGGIQRYVLTLTRSLRDLFGEKQVRVVPLNLRDNSQPQSYAANLAAKATFVAGALRQGLLWRPDLVICTHVGFASLGRLLRTLHVAPYWVVAHGIDVRGRLPESDRHALVRADRVLAVSKFTGKQVVQSQGVNPERIFLLPPCLDDDWMPAALPQPDHSTQRRPTLLTVSRLSSKEQYKGHDLVLQALPIVLEQFPSVLYVIAGDGDDRPRLENLAHTLGLGRSVRFAGAVTSEALANYYRECDIFVMPAKTIIDPLAPKGEGFGIVFLEAMANGKPVIGPSSGAPSEFIRHQIHGLLVDPGNPRELASAIIELIGAPARAELRMGAAGRDLVISEYSYARFSERLRDLFGDAQSFEHSTQAQSVS